MKLDDLIRSEVKLAEHLRTDGPSVCTPKPRREDQKRHARVILCGHSRGGSAMVELARKLEKSRILALLAVQVDSVRRFGVDDRVIPPHIARAANCDPPDGMAHGREEIRAADRSEILSELLFRIQETPIYYPEYPWYDWSFAKTHTQIACDPAVWSRVEALIRQQMAPASAKQE